MLHVRLLELSLETCFEIVEETQTGAADTSGFDQLDLGNEWRVQGIDFFHADAIADFADGEGLGYPRAPYTQDNAFKDLDALAFFALGRDVLNALMESHGLSGTDLIQREDVSSCGRLFRYLCLC